MVTISFSLHENSKLNISGGGIFENWYQFEFNIWRLMLQHYAKDHTDNAEWLTEMKFSDDEHDNNLEGIPYEIEEIKEAIGYLAEMKKLYEEGEEVLYDENTVYIEEDGDESEVFSCVDNHEILKTIHWINKIWQASADEGLPFNIFIDWNA